MFFSTAFVAAVSAMAVLVAGSPVAEEAGATVRLARNSPRRYPNTPATAHKA